MVRRSHTHRSVVLFTTTALALSVAPAMAQRGGDRGGGRQRGPGPSEFTAEQTDRVVRTLPLGAAGLLELRNLAGDIAVTAAPGREARVEIVRRARGRTEADAKIGLERTRVTVDHTGERAIVAVEPSGERRPPYHVSVAYIVTAPAGTRIVASSLSGHVTVTDIKGEVSALVTRGNVTIQRAGQVSAVRTIDGNVLLTDLDSDRGVMVSALSGNVQLERVRVRRIDVEVTGGNVVVRGATSETVRLSSLSGSIEYAGALANGGRYQFQAHSGNVRLDLSGPTGMDLNATTFRGNVRLAPSLTLAAPLTTRGSVRGTVGDGAASVVVKTLSGDIEIGWK
jgi:hypothetical protein